jgi:prolyl oligopeptidase
MTSPPHSAIEVVTDVLHGFQVADPYRWLEEQDSPQTRSWIDEQTQYARAYLDSIPGRDRIRQRIREFLAIETYDSVQAVGLRYFFRKRLPEQEQPCIYTRKGAKGKDQLLIDPAARGTGACTAVKPLLPSSNGRLLLYEVKEGGERTGTFEIFDVEKRRTLPDVLPRGYLRGFAFAPDGKSFYYVHEALDSTRPFYRAVYHHIFGTMFSEDREILFAGEDKTLRLCLASDRKRLAIMVYRMLDGTRLDFYVLRFASDSIPELVLQNVEYHFAPVFSKCGMFAITDRDAPNLRIVKLLLCKKQVVQFLDIVPETKARINNFLISGKRIFVSYDCEAQATIEVFDLSGKHVDTFVAADDETVRLVTACDSSSSVLIEKESFTQAIQIFKYRPGVGFLESWAERTVPFDMSNYGFVREHYRSKDGTAIPMFLVGRKSLIANGVRPIVMTSYGGFGLSMTPQFSVFVVFLLERGCLFALPRIRGGSEFGSAWHNAAKRHNRQTAYDDFLSAAESLIGMGRTTPENLAIFGGSNSGLLVGAALTQRPDLFRAVLCIAPILDMLRYHLFDNAHIWKDEFGTVEDPEDFAALWKYSPYHHVKDGSPYPATMIVAGDADRNCNSLHARKMTARLQAANTSRHPIFIDYNTFRGHSPVLPLSIRTEGLTDRMAFLCNQLGL